MPLKIKTFDIGLFVIPLIFLAVSVAEIYGLVSGTNNEGLEIKQLIHGLIGLGLMVTAYLLDYRFFKGTAWIFYIISIILLVLVEIFGKTAKGATNWLDLGFFQLQPSEVAKVFLITSLAAFFSDKIGKLKFRDIALSALILSIPLVLILKEPDFGSAMVIILVYFTLLFAAKPARIHSAIILAVIGILLSIVLLSYLKIFPFQHLLKDYQRQRIAVFLDPALDPMGRGYNVKQAQITIGAGGITGKGLGRGTQSQLQFLPEPHTDFIIAGIGESFGFLGIFFLLLLYCVFILKLLTIAKLARDNFGMLVVLGIAGVLLFQGVINIGMNVGLMPVTGITLPFLSYGGTSLIMSFFAVGLVGSIFIRHKKINF